MPNANYRAGRALEYRVMRELRDAGHTVMRTAGSHGPADLIALAVDNGPVMLIQCKRSSSVSAQRGLARKFMSKPPLQKSPHYEQWLAVGIRGDTLTRWYRL